MSNKLIKKYTFCALLRPPPVSSKGFKNKAGKDACASAPSFNNGSTETPWRSHFTSLSQLLFKMGSDLSTSLKCSELC